MKVGIRDEINFINYSSCFNNFSRFSDLTLQKYGNFRK